MKFKIVYDKPGRIRFRCGGGVFDKTLESAVHKLTLANSCVISAEVHCENGGILVYYKKGHREEVIKTVSQINPKELVPIENGGGRP